MTRADVFTTGAVLAGLVFFSWLIFFAPKAPELDYRPVEVAGSALSNIANTVMTHIDYSANIVQGGYITAHQAIGAAPGPVIGVSAYLEPGRYNGTLAVDPRLVADTSYVLLLHRDDGDAQFNIDLDLPVTSDGEVVRGDLTAKNIVTE